MRSPGYQLVTTATGRPRRDPYGRRLTGPQFPFRRSASTMASLFHPRLFLLVALLAPLGSMAVHAHPDHHQPSHQSDHLGNPDQQQHQDHGH